MFLVFTISISGYTQYKRTAAPKFSDGLTLSGKGGVNMFFGDLVDNSRNSFSFGLTLDREVHKLFTVRTSLMCGKMKGTQVYQADPNFTFASFKNSYLEWTIGGTYSILNHIYGYFRERKVQPYFLLQLGLLYYNATEYWGLEDYIQDFGPVWRKVSGITPVAGIGGGATFWINPRWKASLEISGFYPFSDKLDGHDYWYMKPDTTKTYKTKSNDFYYTATVGVVYLFNVSKFKNDFSYNRKTYEKNHKYFPKKARRTSIKRR